MRSDFLREAALGECRYCRRDGFFVFTDENGLCKHCVPRVAFEVSQHARIIEESRILAIEGKTLSTRLGRCELVIEHCDHLARLESRGIGTISPRATTLAREFRAYRDQLIVEEATKAADKAIAKCELAATTTSQLGALNAAILKLGEMRELLGAKTALDPLEGRLAAKRHQVQLRGYLDAACKAEFKGNWKKALDQYQEALYFLRHCDVPEQFQRQELAELEGKIRVLEQRIESR